MNSKPKRSFIRFRIERRRAVAAVDHDFQRLQRLEIEGGREFVQIRDRWRSCPCRDAHALPIHKTELPQMVDVEQFVRFGRREIRSFRPEKLQRIPLGRIVTCRDGDAAGRIVSPDRMLNHGRRNDPEIHNLMPACQQAGNDSFADHAAAGARIASQENGAARLDKRSERGSKVDDVTSGQTGANDSA